MLPAGHVHDLIPTRSDTLEDGTHVVHMRCAALPSVPTGHNMTPLPTCTLEQELRFRDGACVGVRCRFGGLWFHPLDLLRVAPLPVEECPTCRGVEMLAPCEQCGGVGVVAAGGGEIAVPDLRVPRG